MTIDLYYHPSSTPCRTVLLVAKAIGIDLNLKSLDLINGEHLSPEFLKINPQHTIPTINDNGFVLWESRAIITYLQNKYGKDDSLYPKIPKERAVVDQRLFLDMDLTARGYQIYNHNVIAGAAQDTEKLKNFNNGLDILETLLEETEFIAGDNITLADLSLVNLIVNLELVNHDMIPYKNIKRWLAKVKATAPGYQEAVEDNLVITRQMIEKFSKAEK